MADPRSPLHVVAETGRFDGRLESWKAIADYLARHVTTVQRWEHEEGLPVHRHLHEKRGSVYAYRAELDEWLIGRSVAASPDGLEPAEPRSMVNESANEFEPGARGLEGVVTPPPERRQISQTSAATEVDASVRNASARPRVLRQGPAAWATLAAAAVALTIAAGVAKDLWPSHDEVLSLAVLPLKNRSPDLQADYFVDGMTEALTTDLASLRGVRVIAHQSVMQYRETGKPAAAIARELGVAALVEGSVQRIGGRIRVDIRLIDGVSSQSLWATTYERDGNDALALHADVSRAIASELHLTLDPSLGERMGSRRPSSSEAWDAYLRARFFWNRRTHEDMSRALEWYQRAIELDASSPLIFAGLADVYATLGPPNTPVSDLITRGTAAAMKAITLDPSMGEPFAALARLRAYDWDWAGAERNYRKAVELAPGYAPARYWFGSFLANQRRCDEAVVEAREAERLDPLSLPGNMVISGIELKCGRVDSAIRRNETVLEFDPGFGQSYDYLGRAYLMRGDSTHAAQMFQRALALTGGRPTIEAMLASSYAASGRIREAEAIAASLAERHSSDKRLASAWSVALVQAGLGHHDASLAWLEHAYADREEWLEGLAIDERFRNLHVYDRFQRLVDRLGLPVPTSAVASRR
jgi:TolB-like protein/Tfp pilus assembly protein PilF